MAWGSFFSSLPKSGTGQWLAEAEGRRFCLLLHQNLFIFCLSKALGGLQAPHRRLLPLEAQLLGDGLVIHAWIDTGNRQRAASVKKLGKKKIFGVFLVEPQHLFLG